MEHVIQVIRCVWGCLLPQYNSLKGLEENLKKLKEDMEELNAKSSDIKKELTQGNQGKEPKEVVVLWIENVKKIGKEVGDLEKNVDRRLSTCCLFGCLSRFDLAAQIERHLKKVTELIGEKSNFGQLFREEVPNFEIEFPKTSIEDNTMTSKTLNMIWDSLMTSENGIIGVYGMGGVGKTYIMKHIKTQISEQIKTRKSKQINTRPEDEFDDVRWIGVPEDATLEKLQDVIAERIQVSPFEKENPKRRAAALSEKLNRMGKYVLIMDGMWEAFPLEDIGIPKPSKSNGCKIVLTTRLLSVCKGMETDKEVVVPLLSPDEAWTLFKDKVGEDVLLNELIEGATAEAVVEKCDHLPLALVNIGKALRREQDPNEWKDALADFQDSTAHIALVEKVFPSLEVSYKKLRDDTTRSCFLYCALYPKDHHIDTTELIEYWIWEGLIDDSRGKRVANMRSTGRVILKELKDAFLLESVGNDGGSVECVKFCHDLIRNMAISITKNSNPRCIINAGVQLRTYSVRKEMTKDVERVSLMRNDLKELRGNADFCELTSLLLQHNSLMGSVSVNFFQSMDKLRVLDLSYTGISALPQPILRLKNLRSLLLRSCLNLMVTPWLGELSALGLLDLSYSNNIIASLLGLENLTNLRSLNLSGTRVDLFPTHQISNFICLEDLLMAGCGFLWGTKSVASSIEESNIQKKFLTSTSFTVLEVDFANVELLDSYLRSGNPDRLERFNFRIGNTSAYLNTSHGKNCIEFKECSLISHGSPIMLPPDTLELHMNSCLHITSLSAFASNMLRLKKCRIVKCREVEWILMDGENRLTKLEEIELKGLEKLRGLCKGVVPLGTFAALKLLTVISCHKLKYLLSREMVLGGLQNLELIYVGYCSSMINLILDDEEKVDDHDECKEKIFVDSDNEDDGGDEIKEVENNNNTITNEDDGGDEIKEVENNNNTITNEDDGGDNEIKEVEKKHNSNTITMSRLRQITLYGLPNLKDIYSGVVLCNYSPKFEVFFCNKLKNPFNGMDGEHGEVQLRNATPQKMRSRNRTINLSIEKKIIGDDKAWQNSLTGEPNLPHKGREASGIISPAYKRNKSSKDITIRAVKDIHLKEEGFYLLVLVMCVCCLMGYYYFWG